MRLAEPTYQSAEPINESRTSSGPTATEPITSGHSGASLRPDHGGTPAKPDRGHGPRDSANTGRGSGFDPRSGNAFDSRHEQHEGFAAVTHIVAADALGIDALGIDPLPSRGLSGLPVPRFGPDTTTSVLLPPWQPTDPTSLEEMLGHLMAPQIMAPQNARMPANGAQSGRRKPAKTFRVPGDRTEMILTGGQIIPGDDGRTGTFHSAGRSVLPGGQRSSGQGTSGQGTSGQRSPGGLTAGGAAALADALYTRGVLRESDWCGSLERSLRRGLMRWVNEEKGAAQWRILPAPLSLVYTDDAPAYSTAVRLPRWREHFHARPDRPIGFFGLRFQSPPRPVHVRRMTERLEKAWPRLGFGLLNLVENACVTSVQGYGFGWGAAIAARWSRLSAMDDTFGWRKLEGRSGMAKLPDMEELDEYDEYYFHQSVPKAAGKTPFQLEALQQAMQHAPETHPDLVPVLSAAQALWKACRRSGTNFYTLNHCQFLSWSMTVAERGRGLQQAQLRQAHLNRLDRAPVIYTVWDPDSDVMTRLMDDYTEFCRTTMQFTDLTWLHAFQIGHAGHEPEDARRHLAAKDRLVRKVMKKHPEAVTFHDPDYQAKPMPDGSLAHAVQALDIVMDILGALDKLLSLLHLPETLFEQARTEQTRMGEL